MKTRDLTIAALSLSVLVSSVSLADEVKLPPEAADKDQSEAVYYTIVPKDTLWDISGKFLNNPFKWPTIWKINPYIKNPHLIYPGNVVKITPNGVEILGQKEGAAEMKAAEEAGRELPVVTLDEGEKAVVLEPEAAEDEAQAAKEASAAAQEEVKVEGPSLTHHNISRKGFVSTKELESAGAIIQAKEKMYLLNRGSEVFISLKDRSSVNVGDRFTIFEVGKEIIHPDTDKKLGNIVEILGSIEITGTDKVIEGRIDSSFREVHPGAKLRAYKEPTTEVVVTEPDTEVKGLIVATLESKAQVAEGDIAYIDKGTRAGLKKGNVLDIKRKSTVATDPMNKKNKVTLPPQDLGTLVVLEADEDVSTGIIVKSVKAISLGDMVVTGKKQ